MQPIPPTVHASPSPLAVEPPLVELAPPEPAPPEPLLGTHTGQFELAHSPTDSTAASHALESCPLLPPEADAQLEHKLEYCEEHLLSTQLVHAGVASD